MKDIYQKARESVWDSINNEVYQEAREVDYYEIITTKGEKIQLHGFNLQDACRNLNRQEIGMWKEVYTNGTQNELYNQILPF